MSLWPHLTPSTPVTILWPSGCSFSLIASHLHIIGILIHLGWWDHICSYLCSLPYGMGICFPSFSVSYILPNTYHMWILRLYLTHVCDLTFQNDQTLGQLFCPLNNIHAFNRCDHFIKIHQAFSAFLHYQSHIKGHTHQGLGNTHIGFHTTMGTNPHHTTHHTTTITIQQEWVALSSQ